MAERTPPSVMAGQRYSRTSGPEMVCEVIRLREGADGLVAMCDMRGNGRNYGVRPVSVGLLKSEEFELIGGPR